MVSENFKKAAASPGGKVAAALLGAAVGTALEKGPGIVSKAAKAVRDKAKSRHEPKNP